MVFEGQDQLSLQRKVRPEAGAGALKWQLSGAGDRRLNMSGPKESQQQGRVK